MTKQEELNYLFGILSEASKWVASADDDRDLVRMEVEERIHNLINGIKPEPDENGLIQSSVHPDVNPVLTEDDYQDLEAAAKLNEHIASPDKVKNAKERWKHGRVRITIDGKPVWKLVCDCHKEIIPGFEKKWHWVPNEPDNKQEQVEAMWAEHEQEGK